MHFTLGKGARLRPLRFCSKKLARSKSLAILHNGSVMTMNTQPTPISSHAAFAANSASAQIGCQAVHSLLSLPARLVAGMPVPMLLRLRVPGAPVPVCVWTGSPEHAHDAPVLADTIVFDGGELETLVLAVEADLAPGVSRALLREMAPPARTARSGRAVRWREPR